MRINDFFIIVFCISLFCYGCKKNDEVDTDISAPDIEYKSFILNPVFNWDDWSNTGLEYGDKISVFAYSIKDSIDSITTKNAKIVFLDDEWIAEDEMALSTDNCIQEILAIYPFIENTIIDVDSIPFTAHDGLFMAGKVVYDGVDSNTDFTLQLQHMVGRLNINVVLNNEYSDNATIKGVTVRGWKNGVLDCERMSLLPLNAGINEEIQIIEVCDNDRRTFKGCCSCIPQKLFASDFTLVVNDKGHDYYIHPQNLQYWISIEKGKITTVEFSAGINNLIINDVFVSEWEPGYNDNGGVYLN